MGLIKEAYAKLYPDKEFNFNEKIKYSAKFNDYNANVKYTADSLRFNLSKKWKDVSKEIKIGLIQSLLNRIFKTKINTTNIDLYNIFIKRVHYTIEKMYSDPILEDSFNRINEKYFYGMIEKPNLKFGKDSLRKLGSYEYGSDTIVISNIFKSNPELMDYIMYHEVLHKKHKFKNSGNRSYHHTREFKKKEKEYKDPDIEKKLDLFLAKHRIRKTFRLPKII
jgi:hypothetical protein